MEEEWECVLSAGSALNTADRLSDCGEQSYSYGSVFVNVITIFSVAMSLPSRTRIFPDQVPLSREDLDAFSQAFRGAARNQGFTLRRAGRYEAWVLAFLAWCSEKPSRQLEVESMGAFRSALRERAAVGKEAVNEAMDALSFLFGAAQAARDHLFLNSRNERMEDDPDTRESHSQKEILSLQVSWQSGGRSPDQEDSSELSSGSDEKTDDASTAEHCIEEFQSQLDLLHSGVCE